VFACVVFFVSAWLFGQGGMGMMRHPAADLDDLAPDTLQTQSWPSAN
jgi:hypothetical protein